MIAAGGSALLLLTVSAAGAIFTSGAGILTGGDSAVYGATCRMLDSVAFERGGERWVRKYVAVADADPADRLRTALRVAANAARSEGADLVLVVAVDERGPRERALMRDHAVGARVVYAPHPARISGVKLRFSARYVDAAPTAGGEFYGKIEEPAAARLEKMMAAMKKPFGCKTPEAPQKAGEATRAGASGKPAHGA